MSRDTVNIIDGTGGGYQAAVNYRNQLKVSTGSAIHEASLLGNAYAWNAVSANIDTTDCMILVSNTSSSQLLVISFAYCQGDIAGQMDFKLCSAQGLTLAGTAILGVNLNRAKRKAAPALAFADETASPAAAVFYTHYQHLNVQAQGTTAPICRIDFDDAVILGQNDCFGIDTILEPAAGFEATVFGYYIDA
jgi:hypothetical protein